MNIPFVDLKAQLLTLQPEIENAIHSVIHDTAFIGGPYVKAFEMDFAKALDIAHCIGVGNGTDALYIALKALEIGKGDEVITAANSFIATAEAVSLAGAKVVFVDCHPESFNINVQQIEKKITSGTKAIIPVHLYGQTADMGPLIALAQKHKLFVIEDASQAHLATHNETIAGTMGDIGCFSFYPGKNLGAYGDAGAVVTQSDELAMKIRMISNHGRIRKYDHEFQGINSRLDGIQAAILSVKLKHLSFWTTRRRDIAHSYNALLESIPQVITPVEMENSHHVFHLYVIRSKNRDRLKSYLASKGIHTGIHYPMALPNLKAFSHLNLLPSDFPISSQYQEEILSLPIYPEMKQDQITYIVECIQQYFR